MKTLTDEHQQNSQSSSLRLNIALSFFAFILIGAIDGTFGVVLPSMSSGYHVDKGTIGLLFLASAIGYFTASFNNGFLVEKLGNRRFLVLGTSLLLLSLGILILTPPFFVVLGTMLFLGMGIASLDAGLNSYIASLPKSTALLNYLHAFYGVGAWLGPLVASTVLALQWHWHFVYLVWASICLLLLLGLLLIFREAVQHSTEKQATEGNIMMQTLHLRVVWIAALFLFFYVGTEVSTGSWSYSLLTEERHGLALFSGWMVSGYWLGLTLGRVALVRVAQRIGSRRTIEGCLGGVLLGVLIIWFLPHPISTALGLWITGFSLGPIFPTTIALMSDLVSARILPGAVGFAASFGSMGAAFFPWLAGNLAQHFGLWTLLPYIMLLTAFMFALWLTLQVSHSYKGEISQQ